MTQAIMRKSRTNSHAKLTANEESPIAADDMLLKPKQVASWLGVSVSVLKLWRATQKPGTPPVTMVGDSVRYSRRAVQNYLNAQTKQY